MRELCGATREEYVCDYPKGHEHDETRHYHDRYFHHHTLPTPAGSYFGPGAFGIEWKVDGAPDEPKT